MSRTTMTMLSIAPLIIVLLVALGLFTPQRSGTPHPNLSMSTLTYWVPQGERGVASDPRLSLYGRGLPVGRVRVASSDINVEIASIPEARRQGLSGHAPLKDDEGMLFVFDVPSVQTFWMIDMKFPLDMIWIGADQKVVGVTANVPVPLPGTLPQDLPLYQSPEPVQYVLEVNAGWAEKYEIKTGDKFYASIP